MKRFVLSALVLVLFSPMWVSAAGFEIALSPARFELTGKSAQRIGQSITLHNLGATETEVSVRSLDWSYSADGEVTYYDELLPESCRPWLTLERRGLKIPPRSKRSFRFQLDIPEGTKPGQCRLMIVVEGVEPAYKAMLQGGAASLNLPVSGRIAVPLYLAVNGALPKLELLKVETREIQGRRTPVVEVQNLGDAHGRLEGALSARDAKGQAFELVPEGSPVMPGQTRVLPLLPQGEGRSTRTPEVTMPFKAEGMLEWERGAFKVEAEFK